MKHNFERYCTEPENIENYEDAKKDNFKGWHCHHRLETHNSDGERRLVDITVDELKALDMYYRRPASELIFMKHSEHTQLHQKGEDNSMYGKHHSEETKKKMREAKKGKHLSEETRKKIREAKKGKPKSEETRKKMREAKKNISEETRKKWSEARKGMRFFNNGKINIRAKECPEGFVPGKLLIYKEIEK